MGQIATYQDLKSAIAAELTKPETLYDPDLCIQLAESRINRIIRNLEMETTATATMTAGVATIPWPSDFGGVRQMRITSTSDDKLLQPISPAQMYGYDSADTGIPIYFAQKSELFEFRPIPNSSYTVEISYYKKLTSLTSTNTTNWFLSAYPDAYLYACCWHACMRLQDFERMQMYKDEFAAAMDEIDNDDQSTRWSGTPLAIRVDHDPA
jgi:hypothetical protein